MDDEYLTSGKLQCSYDGEGRTKQNEKSWDREGGTYSEPPIQHMPNIAWESLPLSLNITFSSVKWGE